mmetsp:Transcript_7202/g.32493  ORF Transcript_7202/g.32493 Transcript_7202/m.32493 type:complete len:229 (-) Transcript_7202:446-1132(-)
MSNTANTAFTRLVHSLPMGYTSVDIAAMGRMTTRATSAAFCTAMDLGAISQNMSVTKVSAAVHSAMLSSPYRCIAACAASVALPMLVTVLPMRIVVRNLLMSLRISVNGESGPSWSLISLTFHGQRVVMAVSLVQKKAYATSSATVPTMEPHAACQSTVIFAAASTAAAATSFFALAARGANMNHATHAATPAMSRAMSASGLRGARSLDLFPSTTSDGDVGDGCAAG